MKRLSLFLLFAFAVFSFPVKSSARYTTIVNQAADNIKTAAYGGVAYKPFVDASFTGGFGSLRADFLGISTVHGAQITSWFFVGAGLGVDVVFSKTTREHYSIPKESTCNAMIPVFADFRFNLGAPTSTLFSLM